MWKRLFKHPIISLARFLAEIDSDKLRHKMAYLSFYALLLIILFAFFTIIIGYFIPRDVLGVSGDFFGGFLNPIFNFFSLLALIFTLVLQTNELRENRLSQQNQTELLLSQKQLLESQVQEQLNAHKMNITLTLLQHWKEKDIHHHRQRIFFDMIEYGITPENIHNPHLVALKPHDGELIYHVTELFEFLHEVYLMVQMDKLDKSLFKKLFAHKLEYWFLLAKNVEFQHDSKQLDPLLRQEICEFYDIINNINS